MGLEAWLGAYHGHEHPHIHAEPLEAHGGAIIGGVALDIVGTRFTSVDIQYGMVRHVHQLLENNLSCLQVNGKLPNLDLINLMVILVERAGMTPRLYGIASRPDFAKNLLTVSRSVLSQVRRSSKKYSLPSRCESSLCTCIAACTNDRLAGLLLSLVTRLVVGRSLGLRVRKASMLFYTLRLRSFHTT